MITLVKYPTRHICRLVISLFFETQRFFITGQRDTALAFVVFAFVTSALSALFLLSYVILPGYRGCPQVVVWSLLFTGFTGEYIG